MYKKRPSVDLNPFFYSKPLAAEEAILLYEKTLRDD